VRQIRFLLACLLCSSAVPPLFAEPIETVKYEYYEVRGLTAREIRASMEEHHKRTHGFAGHDAKTLTNTNWSTGHPPTVTINIIFQMPQWVDQAAAPREVQEAWKRFEKAVQTHEDGHRKIAEECAKAVEARVLAEGPKPGRDLKHDVNNIFTLYNRKQISYDKETQHGKAQGAVLNG